MATYRALLAGCVRVRTVVEVTASSVDEAKHAARAAAETDGFDWGLSENLDADVEPGSIEVEYIAKKDG
jgi:hypothetical protein